MSKATVNRIGLLADGSVGGAVLSILSERYSERLAYVVAPSQDSVVSQRHRELALDVPLLFWPTLDEAQSLPRYDGVVPEIVMLAWWPNIVHGPFLSAGQKVTLNMHPSLLPYGRGKDPNFWALAESEPYGVTIHHVDEGIDSGDIAFQAPLEVGWEDTGGSLHRRAQTLLVDLFSSSLDDILSLAVPRIRQPAGQGSFHKRAQIEPRSVIDLDAAQTGREVLNLLRARTFPPHPACRFVDKGETYEIRIEIKKVENET